MIFIAINLEATPFNISLECAKELLDTLKDPSLSKMELSSAIKFHLRDKRIGLKHKNGNYFDGVLLPEEYLRHCPILISVLKKHESSLNVPGIRNIKLIEADKNAVRYMIRLDADGREQVIFSGDREPWIYLPTNY
jgi:hypothetical protein